MALGHKNYEGVNLFLSLPEEQKTEILNAFLQSTLRKNFDYSQHETYYMPIIEDSLNEYINVGDQDDIFLYELNKFFSKLLIVKPMKTFRLQLQIEINGNGELTTWERIVKAETEDEADDMLQAWQDEASAFLPHTADQWYEIANTLIQEVKEESKPTITAKKGLFAHELTNDEVSKLLEDVSFLEDAILVLINSEACAKNWDIPHDLEFYKSELIKYYKEETNYNREFLDQVFTTFNK